MPEASYNISSLSQNYLRRILEDDQLKHYLQNFRNKHGSLEFVTVSLPFDNVDPLAVLETAADPEDFCFYWEHPESELAIAAGEAVRVIRHYGTNRFDKINRDVEALKSATASFTEITHSLAGVNLFGGASFFDKPLSGVWSGFGNSSFVLPGWTMLREGRLSVLTITLPFDGEQDLDSWLQALESKVAGFVETLDAKLDQSTIINDEPASASLNFDSIGNETARLRWIENVEYAKALIDRGEFEKVVMAREERLKTEQSANATRLLHHLRSEYPGCYSFLYQVNAQAAFVGCTPERLMSIESNRLQTDGLAGSISRGKTATQDEILSRNLLSSGKDLREHKYVVDSIREKLNRYSSEIDMPDRPGIRRYANVQHLHTPITASLYDSSQTIEVLKRMHPTPAVGGYPQDYALPYIQELEQIERGWYAGPIGWMNANGRSEFAVAIRSGLIQPKEVRFYAGCGIVEGSDPEAEWKETELKLVPMLNALRHAVE